MRLYVLREISLRVVRYGCIGTSTVVADRITLYGSFVQGVPGKRERFEISLTERGKRTNVIYYNCLKRIFTKRRLNIIACHETILMSRIHLHVYVFLKSNAERTTPTN